MLLLKLETDLDLVTASRYECPLHPDITNPAHGTHKVLL